MTIFGVFMTNFYLFVNPQTKMFRKYSDFADEYECNNLTATVGPTCMQVHGRNWTNCS